MADWPEFKLVDDTGQETSWTRQGDIRRFVPGLAAQVEWVEVRYKPGAHIERSQMVLRIDLELSDLRSSGIAPGPGGHGYKLAGGAGTVIHYVDCVEGDPPRLQASLAGVSVKAWPQRDKVRARITGGTPERVRAAAQALHAEYDGYEVLQVDGPPMVYGPSSA